MAKKLCKQARKVPYSEAEAEHEAFVRNFYKNRRGRYYKCEHGDHYHLTKIPQTMQKEAHGLES